MQVAACVSPCEMAVLSLHCRALEGSCYEELMDRVAAMVSRKTSLCDDKNTS
jgi:hypothetical protein